MITQRRYEMLSEAKKKQQKVKSVKSKGGSKVKDYGSDPFFVKKAADSKDFLDKHGFPEELLHKR